MIEREAITEFKRRVVALLAAVLLLVFAVTVEAAGKKDSASSGKTLFRFKDDQGTMVTSHILPPDVAKKGYEVVTYSGDVVKRVAPAMTEEEKQAMLDAIEQKEYDRRLLLRYGSLAELRKSQKRKRDESEAKLSVLESNLSNIKLQIEAEQSKAANYERQGKSIPDATIASLEKLYSNLETTEDLIQVRHKELATEKERFDYELNRFKEIKGLK